MLPHFLLLFHHCTIPYSFSDLCFSFCCCYVIHVNWYSNINFCTSILYCLPYVVYFWSCYTTHYWSKNRSQFNYFLYLMLSVWPTVVSMIISAFLFISYSILISFLLYRISSISVRQSFSYNLLKHFSTSAKNSLCFCDFVFVSLWLHLLKWWYPLLVCFSSLQSPYWACCFVLPCSGSTISHASDTVFVMKMPLWLSYFFFNICFWSISLSSTGISSWPIPLPHLYNDLHKSIRFSKTYHFADEHNHYTIQPIARKIIKTSKQRLNQTSQIG